MNSVLPGALCGGSELRSISLIAGETILDGMCSVVEMRKHDKGGDGVSSAFIVIADLAHLVQEVMEESLLIACCIGRCSGPVSLCICGAAVCFPILEESLVHSGSSKTAACAVTLYMAGAVNVDARSLLSSTFNIVIA